MTAIAGVEGGSSFFFYGSSRVPPFGGSIVDKQHDRYNKENKEEEGKGGVER